MEGRDRDLEIDSSENPRDEKIILADQDQTHDPKILDETLGQDNFIAEPVGDEPADFVRGEVDVVEQMKRTARAMKHIVEGHGEGGGTNT